MGEHGSEEKSAVDSVEEKTSEKIQHDSSSSSTSSSSSSSDSDDDRRVSTDELKSKVLRLFGREKPVHEVLGGGKAADIILWRDKKVSGGLLGMASAIWVLLVLLDYHLVALACHILILCLAMLFLWSNASAFITKSPSHIPQVGFPEKLVREFASAVTIEINHGLDLLERIACGRDLKKFVAVIFGLWVLSLLGSCCSFLTLAYFAIILVLSVPVLYEQHSDQVDSFGERAVAEFKKQYAVFDAKVLSKMPRGLARDKKMA